MHYQHNLRNYSRLCIVLMLSLIALISVREARMDGFQSNIPVGSAPTAIAVNPATNKTYVATANSNNVTVINGADNTPPVVTPGPPSVTNATTTVNTQTTSGLVISPNPADGAEVTHFKITNIQNGTLFQNDGTTKIYYPQFITVAEGSQGLKFTPANNLSSPGTNFRFEVQASTSNSDAGLGGGTVTGSITVSCGATTVTNRNDSGAGSLRASIKSACPGTNVTFDMTAGQVTSPITLTSGQLLIDKNLTIQGPGANLLTISGNNASKVFSVSAGNVTLYGLTITKGIYAPAPNGWRQGDGGGGIYNSGTLTVTGVTLSGNTAENGDRGNVGTGGGAICNDHGILIINNSTISGNTATGNYAAGGGIFNYGGTVYVGYSSISGNTASGNNASGGGINNGGTLTVTNSTISGNTARDDVVCGFKDWCWNIYGGGIYNGGTLNVTNSTISGNTVSGGAQGTAGFGGGIAGGTMTITNSTIAGNTAISSGGGGGISGGIGGVMNIKNTIIAGNSSSFDPRPDVMDGYGVYGVIFTSKGNNVIGKSDGSTGFVNGVNGDIVGTIAAPVDALLGSLANNGGPTQTMALLPGSPAIDAGNNAAITVPPFPGPPFTDQRSTGFARIVNGSVDIGSFESGFVITTTTVSSSLNPSDLGQPVIFTARVTSEAGTPTGTVQFKVDGVNAGAPVALSSCCPGSNASGAATFTTSSLTAGTHNITADYTGGNYLASTGTLAGGQLVKLTLSINDISIIEGDDGTKTLNFTVALSVPSNLPVTANYATANGTATAPSDYTAIPMATLTFNPGETTRTIGVTINCDQNFEPDEAFTVNLSSPVNATIDKAQGTGTIQNDDVQGGFVSFSQATYSVSKSAGFVTLTVNRTNDTSQPVTVDYATDDAGAPALCAIANGLASARCDFTVAMGTLKFAPGETQKSFSVLLNPDSYVEGPELFTANLSNLTGGAAFVTPSSATVTITDIPAAPPANQIDDANIFVRQHYHDFLNREPDADGLAFWTHEITSCGADAQCIELKRINVSAAFFLSIEFQETGGTAYLASKAAFGGVPAYNRFERDAQALGRDYIATAPGAAAVLEANKAAYFNDYVKRPEFISMYGHLFNEQYVDALVANTGISFTEAECDAMVNGMNGGTETYATVLRKITEKPSFRQAEANQMFVRLEYFGYLRRDPDAAGFNFWLTKLDQFNGNFNNADMVKAFLVSGEYRQRFGP
jgi:hypothetical protein